MHSVFLFSLLIGGAVLALQIILSLVGFDTDVADLDLDLDLDLEAPAAAELPGAVEAPEGDLGGSEAAAGLDLLGIRSISAGLATFGAAGLLLEPVLFSWLAAILAVIPAGLAMVGTAYLTLLMLRLESDGSIQLENAVGTVGSVYLTVPGEGTGAESSGLVHLTVQGRTIEVRAITRGGVALPTGSSIVVVAAEGDTVEVVSTPVIEGV